MSLDGLRAWIAEVERKLGARTRVFLVLTVIAIGIGAAGVYLALDARNNAVSKDDVRELQQQLEARIDETATSAAPSLPPAEEAEPSEPEPAEPEPKSGKKGGGASDESSGAAGTPNSATGGAASATELQELVEKAKKRQAEAEQK